MSNRESNKWVVLVLVCFAQFMVVLDATIVNVALPSIQTDLGLSEANLQWIVNAYTLVFGGFLLLGGRAGDLIGRKRLFLGGIVVFTVASLLNGLAVNEGMLIGSRALQGLGAAFISPYSHPDVIAGAGTIGLELVEDAPDLDTVLVPIGGGLISGIAIAVKAVAPHIEVIGVEVEASCAFSAARAAGHIVEIAVGDTIADGLGGNVDPETITWPVIRALVDRFVVVPEPALRQAVRDLLAEDHLVAEGAGAAAVAAAAGLAGIEGRRAAVLVTGANIDLPRLVSLL